MSKERLLNFYAMALGLAMFGADTGRDTPSREESKEARRILREFHKSIIIWQDRANTNPKG